MQGPQLVILAAGLGSRYGGLKQLDGLGPSGETLMEYSIYDAIRAGFKEIVFVIKPEFAAEFEQRILKPVQERIPAKTVFQSLQALPAPYSCPPGRSKPWGTGQAVLAAREAVHSPFAVINADDFYGASAFANMAQNLAQTDPQGVDFCLEAYLLKNTLSEHGQVSRGVCQEQGGFLTRLTETTSISQKQGCITGLEGDQEVELSLETPVSMNFWGFTPQVFGLFEQGFSQFLARHGQEEKAEYYLTLPINQAVQEKQARIRVNLTPEKWLGVTYAQDRAKVQAGLNQLVEQGIYPPSLFPKG